MEESTASPQSAKEAEPLFEKAPNYSEFYLNHAQVGYTGFDIYAFLSEVAIGSDSRPRVKQKARITMSPMQALLLSKFLTNAVRLYENAFDLKVSIPKELDNQEAEVEE